MRKLIFGTSYVASLQRLELIEMWYRLNRYTNPECDLLLVDTPTPEGLLDLAPCMTDVEVQTVSDYTIPVTLKSGMNCVRFTDNIGHLSNNGKDGWSRAYTYGLRCALENKYDYVAHIEGDMLSRIKFDDVIEKMRLHNLGAMSTIATRGNYMEIGLVFNATDYLREIDFLRRYNWQDGTKNENGLRPEDLVAEAMRGRFLYELWPGGRDELDVNGGVFKFEDMRRIYFLTHAWHYEYYHQFMRLHAPELNWQPIFT